MTSETSAALHEISSPKRFAGGITVRVVRAGWFRPDAGGFFGVVPKPLWSRFVTADDRGRVLCRLNLLLVEADGHRLLVETGTGVRMSEKDRDIKGVEGGDPAEALRAVGEDPASIDYVVVTHLHYDHAGGMVDAAGRPVFPNARYVVQRGEIDFARTDNERIRASYVRDDFEPVAALGMFEFVEGDARVDARIDVLLAPGHTPFLHVPVIRTGEHTIAFLADLVPTTSHVPFPYIMGYDLEPLRTLESKKRILGLAFREGWRLVFEHDDTIPLGVLHDDGGRLRAVPCAVEA